MAEPTVPVPVSLIYNALDAIRSGHDPALWPDVVQALDALLSQPTPTAERDDLFSCLEIGDDGYNHWDTDALDRLLERHMNAQPTAPPSIADMVPGTEFLCEGRGAHGVEHHMRVTENVYCDGARILWCLTHEFGATATYVDPSTIRDVTPPTA